MMGGGVMSALFVELALITYRGAATQANKDAPIANVPVPAEYAGAFVVFGVLSLFSGRASAPAGLFAWGLVIATALNFFTETSIPGISFISPSNPVAAPTPIGGTP